MLHKKKDEKKTRYFYSIPLTKESLLTAFFILALIVAICILSDAVIIKHSIWVDSSLGFLTLSAILYHYAKTEEISDRDYKITNLNQEIKKLKDIRESNEHIIELLETQIEKANNNSHQE